MVSETEMLASTFHYNLFTYLDYAFSATFIYIYIYIYPTHTHTHIYIYIYIYMRIFSFDGLSNFIDYLMHKPSLYKDNISHQAGGIRGFIPFPKLLVRKLT